MEGRSNQGASGPFEPILDRRSEDSVPEASRTTMRGLSAERFLRTHPIWVVLVTIATVACIALAQLHGTTDVTLALSYSIPLWLFAYAAGPVWGVVMAVGAAALWLHDAAGLGLARSDMGYIFAARALTNVGLVVMAVLTARAAAARDGHLAAQEQLLQFRRDLVAAFSHDLRSPLAAIVGNLQIAREIEKAPGVVNALDGALASTHHLDSLIRDMMGVEQSSSPLALHISTLQPFQLINDIQMEFGDLSRKNDDLRVLWEVDPNTPPLHTDRGKLTSIVRNLVNNAFKFTYAGSVRVSMGYDPLRGVHHIEVADTGCGIPAEAIPHIFKRFYREPNTAPATGFGFGLFVVKCFTDFLGGSIEVTSQLGRGTCFTVTLPRLTEPHTEAAAASASNRQSLKIVQTHAKARNAATG